MSTSPVSVRLDGVGRDFGIFTALHDINLDIGAGEFVSLLGPSGCGKTTTLRLIAGFDSPTRGSIMIADRNVTTLPPNKRKLGMVFQNYALFPHMTVAENIGFGLKMAGVGRAEIEGRVRRMLDMIHLSQYGDRMPMQLSGGQQQRVAIARSLVTEPSVLLLDEPMAALDKNLRHSMQSELRQMQQAFQITTILVTHDQDEALTMSDTVVVMEGGYIRQSGRPEEIYNRPSSGFVANFLGISNNFPAMPIEVSSAGLLKVELRVPGTELIHTTARGVMGSDEQILSIRPECISLSSEPVSSDAATVAVSGTVIAHVFRGSYHDYSIATEQGVHSFSVFEQAGAGDRASRWNIGAKVWAYWNADAQNVFAANS